MKYFFVFILNCCVFSFAFSQTPCDDSQAINYKENGDCLYKKTKLKVRNKVKFVEKLEENSGLLSFKGGYLTHNDSGGKNELYFTNAETGEIISTIKIANARNVDWEDLAQDADYVYIGDVGNNRGNRKDLIIYKIPKADLQVTTRQEITVKAAIIAFDYENRPKTLKPYKHDYDCEGFFYFNGKLHLFTKNWGNAKTYHYTLPAEKGQHTATLQDSLHVKGLITAADISSDGKEVLLLGYTKKKVFLWWCHNFEGDAIFSGINRRFEIGSWLFKGQAEGVAFIEENKAVYSAEKIGFSKQKAYQFSLIKFKK